MTPRIGTQWKCDHHYDIPLKTGGCLYEQFDQHEVLGENSEASTISVSSNSMRSTTHLYDISRFKVIRFTQTWQTKAALSWCFHKAFGIWTSGWTEIIIVWKIFNTSNLRHNQKGQMSLIVDEQLFLSSISKETVMFYFHHKSFLQKMRVLFLWTGLELVL